MYKNSIKIILVVATLISLSFSAKIDIEKNIYAGAEDIIRMDEKMNRAIAEHNQLNQKEDAMMRLNTANIEDFEEVNGAYILKREILDANHTKVDIKIDKGMLTILTTTTEEERMVDEQNTSITTTISSSETSLFIPKNANTSLMKKKYENGILEIKFPKK